jgi:hypothetical protein
VVFSGSFGMFPKAIVQYLLHCFGMRLWHEFQVTVQHFGGTEIKEKTCNLLQKIMERV